MQDLQIMNTISKLTGWLQVSEIATMVSFLVLLLTLVFKFVYETKFYYIYIIIPSSITIFFGIITANLFLRIKDYIEQTMATIKDNERASENIANISNDPQHKRNKSTNFASIFSYVTINTAFILLFIFIILLLCRLDKIIFQGLHIIFIPFYLLLLVCLVYALFISPAFLNSNLYFEIVIVFLYILSSFIFSLLLCTKVSKNNSGIKFLYVFLPIYFSMWAHIIQLIVNSVMTKENIMSKVFSIVTLIFEFLGALIIQIKNDEVIKNGKHFVEAIIILIGFVVYAVNLLISMYFNDVTNEKNE